MTHHVAQLDLARLVAEPGHMGSAGGSPAAGAADRPPTDPRGAPGAGESSTRPITGGSAP